MGNPNEKRRPVEWIREGTRDYHPNGYVMRQLSKAGKVEKTGARCVEGRRELEPGKVDHDAQCRNFACAGSIRKCFRHGGQPAGEQIRRVQQELTREREERINRYMEGMPAEVARKLLAYQRDPNRARLETELEVSYGMLYSLMHSEEFNPIDPVNEERIKSWLLTIATLEEKANKIATSEQYVASPQALRKIMNSLTQLVKDSLEGAYKEASTNTESMDQVVSGMVMHHVEVALADCWRRFLLGMDRRGQGEGIASDALQLVSPAEEDAIDTEFHVEE